MGNSIKLEGFEYRLRDIKGNLKIDVRPELVEVGLEDITFSPDAVAIQPSDSQVKVNGKIEMSKGGFSGGQIRLQANDIFFNERFRKMLPDGIGSVYGKLSPEGRFDLHLEDVKISPNKDGQKHIDFEGQIAFKDCKFETTPAVTKCDVKINIKGWYNSNEGFGDIDMSVVGGGFNLQEKRLADVRADIVYDTEAKSFSSDNFSADCYGGVVLGKFCFEGNGTGFKYLVQSGFEDIDLKRFLSDTSRVRKNGNNGYSSGRLCGSLNISGGAADRIGMCRLKVTDMEVGKMSPMAKLLAVLQLNEPTNYAFDQMVVDSYIKRDRLHFERIDLSGRAVAFNGSGQMNLVDQGVDLTLTARSGRLVDAEPTVWQSLTDALGGGVIRMNVKGSLYDPQITTETLPVIKNTFGILGTRTDKGK